MFLKNKWINMSIKKKIFVVTASFILAAFLILYFVMYTFMPRVYEGYKYRLLNNNSKNFVKELEVADKNNLSEVVNNFAYENNAIIRIEDENGNSLVKPIGKPYIGGRPSEKGEIISIEKNVYIKSIDKDCSVSVRTMYKPIDEATQAIKLFMPFMIVIGLIVSLAIARIYSKFIDKKLREVNSYAKKISLLDFSEKIDISGNDEVAQLYGNLNIMSDRLNIAIKDLEESNKSLKSDIEKERIQEKSRREFIATISHELKSPLTVLSGQLEGMKYNIGKYKDRDKYIDECSEIVISMQNIVNDTLSISKLESMDEKLKITEVCVTDIVEEVIYKNKYFIDGKNIDLDIDIEEEVFTMVDKELFKRAVSNIIINAFKYTEIGEQVKIKLTSNELLVENTGITMAKEELENIFKAFYRIDKSRSRKTGGTGLGLYIVKNILDKHKLIYGITSEDNKVSFKVNF